MLGLHEGGVLSKGAESWELALVASATLPLKAKRTRIITSRITQTFYSRTILLNLFGLHATNLLSIFQSDYTNSIPCTIPSFACTCRL